MMMTKTTCAIALLTGLTGCGTWAGNPKDPKPTPPTEAPGNSEVVLEIRGTQAGAALVATTGIAVTGRSGAPLGTVSLTSARIVLREIRLEQTGDTTLRQDFEGPYVVDLLTDRLTPTPQAISLDAGLYASLRLKLAKLEDGEVALPDGDPLAKHSMYITGTFTPVQGAARSLTFRHEFDEEFKIRPGGSGAVQIVSGAQNKLVIDFDLDRWFDFTGQEQDLSDVTDQAIVLDENASEAGKKIREEIKENAKGSAEFKDKDD